MVGGPGDEPRLDLVEGDVGDFVGVPRQRSPLAQAADLADADRVVAVGEAGSVGAEGQREDGADPGAEDQDHHAGPRVPEADRLVIAGRRDDVAVGVEGDAVEPGGVAPEGGVFLPARDVPELDRVVAGGGGERPAIGAEGEGADGVGMLAQGDRLLRKTDAVEPDLVVRPQAGHPSAVGAEGHRVERPGAGRLDHATGGAGLGVVDRDPPVRPADRHRPAASVEGEPAGLGFGGCLRPDRRRSGGVKPRDAAAPGGEGHAAAGPESHGGQWGLLAVLERVVDARVVDDAEVSRRVTSQSRRWPS